MSIRKRSIVQTIGILVGMLLLSGCQSRLALADENGVPWGADWNEMGRFVGVEDPGNGLVQYEYNDVQAFSGIYYSAWSCGEAETITNAEGEEAELFPAQLYFLVQESDSEEQKAHALAQRKAIGENGYELTQLKKTGEYTFYTMAPKNDSPFTGGILALGEHGRFALSVELMWAEDVYDNPEQVVDDFIAAIHYRTKEE